MMNKRLADGWLTTVLILSVYAWTMSLATQRSQLEWRDPSPHAARFANVGRLRLHYLDWGGQGNVLLFLPGLGQSAHIFDGLAPHFTSHHRVLGLTLRGQGKSDRPESGYDTATLVDDLQGFLDTQHISTVSLISHSMSGNQATEFARRYPQRVKKLIYIEAAYDFTKMPGPDRDPLQMETPREADLKSVAAGMRWFERVFGFSSAAVEADTRDVNLKPDGTLTLEPTPHEVARQLWQGMISYTPQYHLIAAPILAIYALSESHPFLSTDSTPDDREKANRFWRSEFVPYQKHSIAQLLDSRGPLRIVVLRNTKHLCFIAKEDEAQVVAAMNSFLKIASKTEARTD